jgi:hypothetical protein
MIFVAWGFNIVFVSSKFVAGLKRSTQLNIQSYFPMLDVYEFIEYSYSVIIFIYL